MVNPSIKAGDVFTTKQGCKLKVIEYHNTKNILVEFQDNYKYRTTTSSHRIFRGGMKNPFHPSLFGVGFVGIGKHLASINGKDSPLYITWRNMLSRCYNPKYQETRPSYKGCEVCREWHNFQNFAEWYTNQKYYNYGYALDKDILIDGNKIYSPSTCVLTPLEINAIFTKTSFDRNGLPMGVMKCRVTDKYIATIYIDGKNQQIGFFKTIQDASSAYQQAKKKRIKQVALEWQNRIDERLFNALMAKTA